jgi:hypothetical protein
MQYRNLSVFTSAMREIGSGNEILAGFSDKTFLVNIVFIYLLDWMAVFMIYVFHGN